jgi:hypothetical protein
VQPQPVSLRQGRGARLSFLGGRKKDQAQKQEVNGDHAPATIPEEEDPKTNSNPPTTKDGAGTTNNRRSFFRTLPPLNTGTADAGTASSRAGGTGPLHQAKTNGTADSQTSGNSSNSNREWVTDVSAGNSSVVVSEKEGHQPRVYETQVLSPGQGGHSIMGHGVGSVRKRLSLLRLGKKSSRERSGTGGLAGLDEE